MALKFYSAYMNSFAQEPVDDWEELMQESINDTWEDTSTIMTVKGQISINALTYAEESIQLNSVFDPTTNTLFGDEYRKIIYKTYGTSDRWKGKYYQWDNKTWLVTNTSSTIGALNTAIARQCNNYLKWTDANGIYKSFPCVFERNLKSTGYSYGSSGVPQIKATTAILVQKNSATSGITINQRLIFDGQAFQIEEINNHISDTYMEFYIFATQTQPNDDLTNSISNSSGVIIPTTDGIKVLPQTVKILQGTTQIFTVYNYNDGVAKNDTFTIVASGIEPSATYYVLTILGDNSFSIQNIKKHQTPLQIVCTDNITSSTLTIKIILGGVA
jgi:hypothetical protein